MENVQLCKNAVFFALQKTKLRTFCFAEHFPLENVCKNAFLHQMIFAQQNVTNAFWQRVHFPLANVQRTFSKGKCSASHLTL